MRAGRSPGRCAAYARSTRSVCALVPRARTSSLGARCASRVSSSCCQHHTYTAHRIVHKYVVRHRRRRNVHGNQADPHACRAGGSLGERHEDLLTAQLLGRLHRTDVVDPRTCRVQRRKCTRKRLVGVFRCRLERTRLRLATHTDFVAGRDETLDVHRQARHRNHGRLQVLFGEARLREHCTYNIEHTTRNLRIFLVKLHLVAHLDEQQHAGVLFFELQNLQLERCILDRTRTRRWLDDLRKRVSCMDRVRHRIIRVEAVHRQGVGWHRGAWSRRSVRRRRIAQGRRVVRLLLIYRSTTAFTLSSVTHFVSTGPLGRRLAPKEGVQRHLLGRHRARSSPRGTPRDASRMHLWTRSALRGVRAMSITSPAAKRARTIHAKDVAPSMHDEFDEFDVPEEDLLRAVESAEARPTERDATRPASSPPDKAPNAAARMPPTPPSSSPASSAPPVTDRSIPPAPAYDLPYAGTPDDPLALERTTMNKEWFDRLEPSMRRDSFASLKQFLDGEKRAGKTIFPPPQLIHSWSRTTPLEKVKVVIIGQDPYHQPGQACGHSFSVPMGKAVPASLQNIYKELKAEYPDFVPPKHG